MKKGRTRKKNLFLFFSLPCQHPLPAPATRVQRGGLLDESKEVGDNRHFFLCLFHLLVCDNEGNTHTHTIISSQPTAAVVSFFKAISASIDDVILIAQRLAQVGSITQFVGAGAGSGCTNATAAYAGSIVNAACGRFVVPPELTALNTSTASSGVQLSLSWRWSHPAGKTIDCPGATMSVLLSPDGSCITVVSDTAGVTGVKTSHAILCQCAAR